jgi:hypothetical protein
VLQEYGLGDTDSMGLVALSSSLVSLELGLTRGKALQVLVLACKQAGCGTCCI